MSSIPSVNLQEFLSDDNTQKQKFINEMKLKFDIK